MKNLIKTLLLVAFIAATFAKPQIFVSLSSASSSLNRDNGTVAHTTNCCSKDETEIKIERLREYLAKKYNQSIVDLLQSLTLTSGSQADPNMVTLGSGLHGGFGGGLSGSAANAAASTQTFSFGRK
jgi:hypothetical protein